MREKGLGKVADSTLFNTHRIVEVYMDCRLRKEPKEEIDRKIEGMIKTIKAQA